MKELFLKLQDKGYRIHNKRLLGNPLYTSEEVRAKDFLKESMLVIDWFQKSHNIHIGLNFVVPIWKGEYSEIYSLGDIPDRCKVLATAFEAALDKIK